MCTSRELTLSGQKIKTPVIGLQKPGSTETAAVFKAHDESLKKKVFMCKQIGNCKILEDV